MRTFAPNYRSSLTLLLLILLCGASGCGDDPATPPAPNLVQDHRVLSSDYLNNRFFKLDLSGSREPHGREPGESILLSSIRIFRLMVPGPLGANDIENVAAYIDSTGFRDWNDVAMDFSQPWNFGSRWRQILDTEFDFLLNADGGLVAIDLRSSQFDDDVLAIIYSVVDQFGSVVGRIGDVPGVDTPNQSLPGGTTRYYRMKLLKSSLNKQHDHVYGYVLRNIYSLGGINIDATTFDLRIEANDPALNHPELDENGINYLRIFGLDVEDPARIPGADGIVDMHNPLIFDLHRGLLKFPLDFPEPFYDSTETGDRYRENTGNDPAFDYSDPESFLRKNQADQFLYNPAARPADFSLESYFSIVASYESAP